MSQHIQGAYALSAGEVSEKRKRGRPCKDSVRVENRPAAESSKKRGKKSVASASCANENGAVGQAVTGVIDGSFDAGYLLTIRVGDSSTLLRGIVFLPRRYARVNALNDVAPRLMTYQRKRVNLSRLSTMPYGPFKPMNQASSSSNSQPPNPQLGISKVPVRQSLPVMLTHDAGLSLSGKANSPQVEGPGLGGQSTAIMTQSESAKVSEQDKVPQEIESSKLMKGPDEVELNEKSKAGPASELVVDLLPDVEASSKLTEGPNEVEANENPSLEPVTEPDSDMPSGVETSVLVGANDVETIEELKVDPALLVIEAVADEPVLVSADLSKDLVPSQKERHDIELNELPLVSEPELMDSEPNSELVNSLFETQSNEEMGLAVEVPNAKGKPAVVATSDITGVVSFSAVKDIDPEMVTEGEVVPPGETELHIAASGDITGMECDD